MSRMAVAVALVGALLLAGCNGGGDPEPLDPSTMDGLASSVEPNTPQSDEPTGEATFDPGKETAREFLRRWVEIGNEMQVSGDTKPFRALSHERCLSCSKIANRVDEIYEAGGKIVFDGQRIISITKLTSNQFHIQTDSGATDYKESADGEWESLPGGPATYDVGVDRREDGSWVVLGYEVLPQ